MDVYCIHIRYCDSNCKIVIKFEEVAYIKVNY